MSTDQKAARGGLLLVFPFLLWGLGFIALYAAHGLACATGWSGGVRLILCAIFALLLLAHAWLSWVYWRRLRKAEASSQRFVRLTGFALSLAALASSIWTGSPVLFLSICS